MEKKTKVKKKDRPYYVDLAGRCYLHSWVRVSSARRAVEEVERRYREIAKKIDEFLEKEGIDASIYFYMAEDDEIGLIKNGKIQWEYGKAAEILPEYATPADEEGGMAWI